jgi:hypothetical protein
VIHFAPWDVARLWLWIHPWWHATILFGTPIVISTILGVWGLHHSREANRLSKEANVLRQDAIRIGEEQKKSVSRIEQLQGDRNNLQTELNKLQAERNQTLGKIAHNTAKPLSQSDRNAAKLRKYKGERAYVTNSDGSNWGSMGSVIAEVDEDNILTLFTPSGPSSSQAFGICVQADNLHIVEVPMGGCAVQITILERYGNAINYGEAKSWLERSTAPTKNLPRGNNVFNAKYRKDGIAAQRGIYVYAPTDGNPNYSLVTFDKDNQEETGVFYCAGAKDLAAKFYVVQLDWMTDKWRFNGGTGPGSLFLFSS